MMDPPHIVAARLKALRLELKFKTQIAFAGALGIDKSTYNLYEKCKRPLTFETACLIRRKFSVPVDWFFFGELGQVPRDILLRASAAAADALEAEEPKRRKAKAKRSAGL